MLQDLESFRQHHEAYNPGARACHMVRLPSDEVVTAGQCSSMQARKILGHQR